MSEATFAEPSPEGRDDISGKRRVCIECGRQAKRIIREKCNACYERARHGRGLRKWPLLDPELEACLFQVPGTSRTFARRVFSHVDASGDCWEWASAMSEGGYGKIGRGPRGAGEMPAHRAVWQLLIGPIPDDMEYDHLCKNHGCVNPAHGEIVPPAVNLSRSYSPSALYAKRKVCDNGGHPLDGRRTRGDRYCKTCNRERMRAATRAA